jgi:acetyltransferase-like isoleucine patch superfamily enzyme
VTSRRTLVVDVVLGSDGGLPPGAATLVRAVAHRLAAPDGVTLVVRVVGIAEPSAAQAATVRAWCLDDVPAGHSLPDIELLAHGPVPDDALLAVTATGDAAQDADALADVDALLTALGAESTTARPAGEPGHLLMVFVADQTPAAVAHALPAHVLALGALDDLDLTVDAVLVDQHPDPDVDALLRLVDGADVLDPGRAVGVAEAWETGWTRGGHPAPDGYVLLTTATSVPEPDAVRRLVDALNADPVAVAALPGSSAPAAALVRRSALERLRRQHGRALTRSKHAVLALTRLLRRFEGQGHAVVVADSVFGGLPLRQDATVLRAPWTTARLELAHRDAASIGPWSYISGSHTRLVTLDTYERIEIGAYCSIADDVSLVNPGHPRVPVTRADDGRREVVARRDAHRQGWATTFPIGNRWPGLDDLEDSGVAVPGSGGVLTIGPDVWIGYGASVVGPVTIGPGAVIGAGAVVTRDVPAYAVVVGNPGQVVRSRIDEDLVDAMLDIAWWDWPESEVMAHASWFARPVADFVARFGPVTASAPWDRELVRTGC